MNRQDLLELFNQDVDFVSNYNNYHPEVSSNLNDVTDDMWNKIKDLNINTKEYGFYAINTKDVIPWIVGFYVKPEYRKNNNLVQDIISTINGPFCVAISNSNKRAFSFLNKFCKIMEQDKMKTVFYYKRGF